MSYKSGIVIEANESWIINSIIRKTWNFRKKFSQDYPCMC